MDFLSTPFRLWLFLKHVFLTRSIKFDWTIFVNPIPDESSSIFWPEYSIAKRCNGSFSGKHQANQIKDRTIISVNPHLKRFPVRILPRQTLPHSHILPGTNTTKRRHFTFQNGDTPHLQRTRASSLRTLFSHPTSIPRGSRKRQIQHCWYWNMAVGPIMEVCRIHRWGDGGFPIFATVDCSYCW